MEPEYLSSTEAAAYLRLSPATLATWRSRGGSPPFSKLGSRVVYRRTDLERFALERRLRSTAEIQASAAETAARS